MKCYVWNFHTLRSDTKTFLPYPYDEVISKILLSLPQQQVNHVKKRGEMYSQVYEL